jgi:hypothetical protein
MVASPGTSVTASKGGAFGEARPLLRGVTRLQLQQFSHRCSGIRVAAGLNPDQGIGDGMVS